MKNCPSCGWENDDDFNFCLGCGSQLPDNVPAPAPVAVAPAPSVPPVTAVPASTPSPVQSDLPGAATPSARNCPQCQETVPPNFLFCGQCGFRMEPQPAAPAPTPAPVVAPVPTPNPARLVLLLPNGQEGGSYPLKPDTTEIGRTQGNILFLDDPYVSPLHATFSLNKGQLSVRNEDSLNGLFMRLTQNVQLKHNDVLLLGKQLLRFEVIESPTHEVFDPSNADVTPLWGSPFHPYWGRIVQLIAGGREGNAILLGGTAVELGRERGQITFPGDRFISSIHARITNDNGVFTVEDLGSRNGTFICARGEHALHHNDILIVGEQLLRVELQA